MKIKWLGLASFLITSDSGVKIITDPFDTGNGLDYNQITESADIVTVSHEHFDHNNVATVRGNPQALRLGKPTETKGIRFHSVASLHDDAGGLGHLPTDEQFKEIGPVDVLLTPVGGIYTVNAKVATQIADRLKPKVIIPMHYRDGRCNFPISEVGEFLEGKENVTRRDDSEIELSRESLPASTQIIVLKSAL
jgi:L-ascorbate metabolism protein UlaG (beta-lactamase superfamily)